MLSFTTSTVMKLFFILMGIAAAHPGLWNPYETLQKCNGTTHHSAELCNIDSTHRICAQLYVNGTKFRFPDTSNFWEATSQHDWSAEVGDGGYWCIQMWAYHRVVKNWGCDVLPIDCSATSSHHIMNRFLDRGMSMVEIKKCVAQKCLGRYWDPSMDDNGL